jgi:hypothetical protein
MLKHLIFIFIVLFPSLLFSQSTDSLLINDSTKTLDSLSSVIVDSTEFPDSLKTFVPVKRDTLVPIQGEPLSDASTIINKRTFLFTNYRYTGDLLRSFSFNFIKDLGFIGQPHETFIYGVGNNGISFLQDGVLWNNRFSNSLDLNLVQSEDIDSIEIVPSPRGFLYGPYNNPVTVNFITRDFVSPEPYSRIKYYEGPNGEAMIDGKFNSQIMKRWNLSFQATNRSVDETYTNSEFGIWQVNTKLKYFLSNSVNISGSYYFVSSNQGLNGGVDFDSLSRFSNDPNTDLYDPAIAPVLYPNRTLDVTQHNFNLRTLAKPFDNSKLDLSLYYRYNLDEHRDFRDSLNFNENIKNKSYGAVLNYYLKYDIITLQVLGDYEKVKNEIIIDNYTHLRDYDRFSFGAVLSTSLLENFIQPAIFFKQKYWGDENINIGAFGVDVLFALAQDQKLYIGYSLRENVYTDDNVPAFEIGVNVKKFPIMLDIKYFSNEYFYETSLEGGWSSISQNIRGVGLSLSYKLWVLLFETNTSYYFDAEQKRYFATESENPINLPDWQFVGGLYVNDLLFDNNLDLKAGFTFYYTGEISSVQDYYYIFNGAVVEPTNKLDFTLAGEIRGAAIFYFIWENLLGNQYYITPYYPMPERNIRFGLAWELFN